MEGSYRRQKWTVWLLWKEGVIFIVGYLQFVERAPACNNIGKETAQVAVHEWYCNTSKEWCHKAIRKLLRRWLQCRAQGGEYIVLAVI